MSKHLIMISIVSNYHESITAECFNYTPCQGGEKANNAAHIITHTHTHIFLFFHLCIFTILFRHYL